MVINEAVNQLRADQPEYQVALASPMPVTLVEPSDISDAMVYLCGHSGRYITGITLPVDAGNAVK
jgi:NAD(P)-dependent dehydrogenase (short-subunit alcohol dehydrogenase family)